MWKVIITDMNGGMLLESLVKDERDTQEARAEIEDIEEKVKIK